LAHASRIGTLGELASGIAHELNQPLTSLCFYSSLARDLCDGIESKELREYLDRVGEISLHAGEIIRRMRSFAGSRTSLRSGHSINALIRDVLKMLEADLISRKVALACEFDILAPDVFVDGIQIQQVIVNLIRNALEAMDSEPETNRSLQISTRSMEGDVQVSITDSGSGLSPAIADKLFEPFQTTKPGGIGLGLRICKTLIEAHGGEIGHKPNANRGMTFYFRLHARSPIGK
jgi:C4-dicarboxylate-specific signal transduction histidine kinase